MRIVQAHLGERPGAALQEGWSRSFPPDKPLRGVTFAPFAQVDPRLFDDYRNYPVSGRAPPDLLP